jgi:TonB family protein
MKKIITFLFLSFLFQSFSFCQITEELESTTDSLKIEEPEEEKIFKVVKEIRRFPGCEGQRLSQDELTKCSEQKMIKFIYSWIKYPAKARENGTEGNVEVQFEVLRDGSVGNIKILKDIGNGCGEEVSRIIELMNQMPLKWTPCPSRGKCDTLKLTIPVQFDLLSFEEYKMEYKGLFKRKKTEDLKNTIRVSSLSQAALKKIKELKNMPRFPGCEGQGKNIFELKECSKNEMLKFIYSNIKYPLKARENVTGGRVDVEFYVLPDGSISNITILKNIGNGCGNEVVRIIELMKQKKWIPGRSSTMPPVKVKFIIPVVFDLRIENVSYKGFRKKNKLDESYSLEYPIIVIAPYPKTIVKEKIFTVVDLPRFPGCEGQGKSKQELKECSDAEMLKFIYSNIKYPAKAKENNTQGRVILKFMVDHGGTVKNVETLRDIGDGCGEEAKRVILSMNNMSQKWIAGKARGPVVKAYFTIPVSFRLPSPPPKK